MDTDTDTDKTQRQNMDMEIVHKYHKAHSPNNTIWITCDISQGKFVWRYTLVAFFPDETMTSRFAEVHTTMGTAPQKDGVSAKLQISVWIYKKHGLYKM